MKLWNSLHEENAGLVEEVPESRTRLFILLTSALALYLELVMIRWHATSSHTFAIFKNVSLLSCFLGLGIGFAKSSKPERISLASLLPMLALQVALFSIVGTTGERINPVSEQVMMGLKSEHWNLLHLVGGTLFLAAIFVLNARMFIPLGYVAGRFMNRKRPIEAYSLNLLGSLIGIGAFFLVSLSWAPPAVWFGVAILAATPLLIGSRRMTAAAIVGLVVIAVALGLAGRLEERRYYSPYQLIALRLPKASDTEAAPTLKVNSAFFQKIHDCRPGAVAAVPARAGAAGYYNFPYTLRDRAGDVLVVGAGTGNDVAGALRNGATSVTAVEIDPAILYLGRRLHPERPYQDPRVKTVVTDARTYIRRTEKTYDTIVYGLLDSHTNLGALTNVRLDSFVYTVEAFHEAIARLNPGGLLVVTYLLQDDSQAAKLYRMLELAYPERKPIVLETWGGTTFATGPGLARIKPIPDDVEDETGRVAALAAGADVATDDWPYFYMKKRAYPLTYMLVVLALAALSARMIRRRLGALLRFDAESGVYFFLGAGFMLVETKVITELGLVFGNTWQVVAIAIIGVLVMGYLANQWVLRFRPPPLPAAFLCLAVFLGAGLMLDQLALGKLLVPIALTAPLFFAGLIFSTVLARSGDIGHALSANLFGAMLGGLLEYNSMYFGLKSLYPLGIAIYLLAFLCSRRQGVSAPAA